MFAWQTSKDDPAVTRRSAAAAKAMYRHDLEERAALLYRLGYTAKRCKQRLFANVAWDFEMNHRPSHADEVDRIVDAVYRRGGAGAGAPSV
jgi:hypothetical protein